MEFKFVYLYNISNTKQMKGKKMNENKPKRSIIKTILYALFYGIFMFIMCSFIFNSCRMSDTEIADDVIFDENTIKAYEADKENFEVLVYDIEKRFEAVEANKLLQLKYFYYIPEAEQMQLTIKYNTVYADAPTEDFIPFELILKDHSGNVIEDYFYEAAEKQGFGYIRIAWNGVKFTDESEYTLHINQEKDGKMVSRGSFLMQKSTTAHKAIKLNKKNAPYIFK